MKLRGGERAGSCGTLFKDGGRSRCCRSASMTNLDRGEARVQDAFLEPTISWVSPTWDEVVRTHTTHGIKLGTVRSRISRRRAALGRALPHREPATATRRVLRNWSGAAG